MSSTAGWFARPPVRIKTSAGEKALGAATVLVAAFLVIGLAAPLALMLGRSFQSASGDFTGLANYAAYFASGAPVYQALKSVVGSLSRER